MKFIPGDGRTNAHLRKWSGSKPLYTASYFSWNAGDDLQKSQEGLLRSLLYQIIQQVPRVAHRLLPNQWALLKLFGVDAARDSPPWSHSELRDSMAAIKSHKRLQSRYFHRRTGRIRGLTCAAYSRHQISSWSTWHQGLCQQSAVECVLRRFQWLSSTSHGTSHKDGYARVRSREIRGSPSYRRASARPTYER